MALVTDFNSIRSVGLGLPDDAAVVAGIVVATSRQLPFGVENFDDRIEPRTNALREDLDLNHVPRPRVDREGVDFSSLAKHSMKRDRPVMRRPPVGSKRSRCGRVSLINARIRADAKRARGGCGRSAQTWVVIPPRAHVFGKLGVDKGRVAVRSQQFQAHVLAGLTTGRIYTMRSGKIADVQGVCAAWTAL